MKVVLFTLVIVAVIVIGQAILTSLMGAVDASACGAMEQAIGACL